MRLPPIFFHYFKSPLPYARTLELQNFIHATQLSARHRGEAVHDYLLLLEHRPVFTAGRRQTEEETHDEELRLKQMGADYEHTQRGGQLTYHGPGQIVGYPILDLSRWQPAMSVRDYICCLQRTLQEHLKTVHGIIHAPSEHTGVFLDDGDGRGAKTKLASIGVQVRHRLTTHGFAFNVTQEPLTWFNTVVACGLADVKAGSIAGRSQVHATADVSVESEIPRLVGSFGKVFKRDMELMEPKSDDIVGQAILEIEKKAMEIDLSEPPPTEPLLKPSTN